MMADDGQMVTLRAGETELSVAPAIGGAIARFRTTVGSRRIDWLRAASTAGIAAGDPGAMACFPLVPFSNRVREGRFRFAGRTAQLPLNVPGQPHAEHGHGWQARWSVVERGDAELTIAYRQPADAWPFPYLARQVFRLQSERLVVALEAENVGDSPMPIGLGLHPYFVRTPKARLTARVAKMWQTDREIMPVALIDPPAGHRLGDGIRIDDVAMDNGFTGWSRHAVIEWPEWNARLTLRADAPLSFLVVYTPHGEDFFCVEPVSHCTDAFNLAAQGRDDTGMIVLSPRQRLRTTVVFAPQPATMS
ncbi:MAG: aldose 1-epimerase [Pseudomonadota bacterium]